MYGYTKIRSHACACMSDNARARAHTHTGPLLDPVVMMLALSTVTGFMAGRFCATPEGRALVRLYPVKYPSMSASIPAKRILALSLLC